MEPDLMNVAVIRGVYVLRARRIRGGLRRAGRAGPRLRCFRRRRLSARVQVLAEHVRVCFYHVDG